MRKKFVFDTNLLLSDPDAIERFVGNDVYITVKVIEELDSKKKGSTALAHAARTVTRKLKRWASEAATQRDLAMPGSPLLVAKLPDDINVIFWPDRRPIENYVTTQPELSGDNVILEHASAINEYLKTNTRRVNSEIRRANALKNPYQQGATTPLPLDGYEACILVTNDAALHVRALTLGFRVEGYESGTAKTPELFKETRVIDLVFDPTPLYNGTPAMSDESVAIKQNEYALLKNEGSSLLIRGIGNNEFTKTGYFEKKGVYGVKPINLEQNFALDALLDPNVPIVCLTGKAGTGKNLLALAAALSQVVDGSRYERVIVTRTPIPFGKELGFLPGSLEEKMGPWMRGVLDAVEFLHNITHRKTAGGRDAEYRTGEKVWQDLVAMGKAEVQSPEHIRGASIARSFFILDEAQNLTAHEAKTFLSRMSEGSKIVLLGDPWQIDNPMVDIETNGLSILIDRAKASAAASQLFAHVNLTTTERSRVAALTTELFA